MALRLGNIARGDDFFDRCMELEDLWAYLEGNHIALTGPRRLGKSSLLTRLEEQAVERGLIVRYIDVQGLDNVAAFINALDAAFPDASLRRHLTNANDKVNSWLARLKKIGVKIPGGLGGDLELQALPATPWGEKASALQTRLSAAPALLLVDEFSVFLEKLILRDAREAEQLLGWLRSWRLTDTACRFLFSGSVGINSLLERHALTTWLNDCHEYKLGPFKPSSARAMLSTLAEREGCPLSTEAARYLCQRTGWLSPFYLNLLLDEAIKARRDRLLENGDSGDRTNSTDADLLLESDIDDGYDRLLAARSRFIHWYQRLKRDLPEPLLAFALAILRDCARAAKPRTRRQLLARLAALESDVEARAQRLSTVLAYLEENGYLGEADKGIQFLSFLLRDYWKRNHAH